MSKTNKIKIGILGASEIAFRRFLPALSKHKSIQFAGVASVCNTQKANEFISSFGGQIYSSYEDLLCDSSIDSVYIPLPPAMHHKWAKMALQNGKHVFLEKPSTTKLTDTEELISLAKNNNLALHENYMFVFHRQIQKIKDVLAAKTLGEIIEYRIDFGFPKREATDFRYNKELGGGALLDCGGYPIRLASILLAQNVKILYSKLYYTKDHDVDMYGNVVLENDNGEVAKVSFGMNNAYKCDLEVWGSLGTLKTERIFTAPDNYNVIINIKKGGVQEAIHLEVDDQFYNSIDYFYNSVYDENIRHESFKNILEQSTTIEEILNK